MIQLIPLMEASGSALPGNLPWLSILIRDNGLITEYALLLLLLLLWHLVVTLLVA